MSLSDLVLSATVPSRRAVPSLRAARVVSLSPVRVTLGGESTELDVADPPAGLTLGEPVEVARVGRRLTIIGRASGDTGWQPHGGTLAASVIEVVPVQWRLRDGIVWWRGQVYRSGGWASGGGANAILTDLPALVRPAAGTVGVLAAVSDASWTQASVSASGELLLYCGASNPWPVLGGSYLLG